MKSFISAAFLGMLLLTASCKSLKNNTADKPVAEAPAQGSDEIPMAAITRDGAWEDIKTGKIRILLPGGIVAPAPLTPADEAFQQKYGVIYYSQGCVHREGEDEGAYNKEVFKYLTRKYGKDWRAEVRKDAVGISE